MLLGCLLTHRAKFGQAFRTLELLRLDHVLILMPTRDREEFEERADEYVGRLPSYETIGHTITQFSDGAPRFGALRFRQLQYLQAHLTNTDSGLLLDDDCVSTRAVYSDISCRTLRAGEATKTVKLNPRETYARIQTLAKLARVSDLPFFTPRASALPKQSPYNFHLTATVSGILGCFKHSPNLFDTRLGPGADYDMAGRLIHEAGRLQILRDGTTQIQMAFVAARYATGMVQEQYRARVFDRMAKRYVYQGEPIFKSRKDNCRAPVTTPRLNSAVTRQMDASIGGRACSVCGKTGHLVKK